MSRAKECTTVYVVADSPEQGYDDLGRSWSQSRRIGWAIDQGTLVQARSAGWRDAHRLRKQAAQAAEREPQFRERFDALAAPERARLRRELPEAKKVLADLEGRRHASGHFEFEHPEALRRLDRLDGQIAAAAWDLDVERQSLDGVTPQARAADRQPPWLDRIAATRDRGVDLGLGL